MTAIVAIVVAVSTVFVYVILAILIGFVIQRIAEKIKQFFTNHKLTKQSRSQQTTVFNEDGDGWAEYRSNGGRSSTKST